MTASCETSPRILIADDQSDLLDALELLLKGQGIEIDAVDSPEAALAAVAFAPFDLLLMDLNYTGDTTSGREGIDLLARVQALDQPLPIVVMTGWGSVDLAVEAMRRGVRDFVQKPWDNAHLLDDAAHTKSRRVARAGVAMRQSARTRRSPANPAHAAAADRCRRSTDGSWRCPGSRHQASAATASTRSASADTRLGISIADVVGKGIPAALLMSNLQAAVRAFASEVVEPRELCHQVNRILCGNIAEGRFISFFYAMLDAATGTLTYTNAGHYLPMLVSADGAVERLGTGGPVLGVIANADYEQARSRSRPAIDSCSSPTA